MDRKRSDIFYIKFCKVCKVFAVVILSVFIVPIATNAATVYVNSSTGNDTTGDGSSGSPYLTFNKGYTVASSGDTLNLTGTFTWTDSGETGDAANTGFTIGKNLTIQGQGADQTIIQAATASTSADRRVFTISSGVTATISDVNIRNAKVSSSYYGGGIANSGNLTVLRADINNNISGAGGAGIDNLNLLLIKDSTVRNNLANGSTGMGAGILSDYYIVSGGYTTITNTTIAYNRLTATTGYTEGGGVHFRKGSGTITNSTIVSNHAYTTGGVGMDDPASYLTIKNTIIANNTGNWNYDFGFRQSNYGNVVDNGYNIVGKTLYYSGWVGTGDWTDTDRNGTFNLYGSSATGTLNIASSFASNNSLNKTDTLAISAGSISINNGASGSNGATSTVPTTDQRGAGRNGTTDIGSYEYDGTLADTTTPSISALATSTVSGATSSTATISWTTDEAATSTLDYGLTDGYGTATTTYATTSHSVVLTGLASSTAYHFRITASDSSANSTTTPDYILTTHALPYSTSTSVASTSDGAVVTWGTSVAASSRISFGLSSSYGSSTIESDTSPRVTNHSLTLTGLPSCTLFHYAIVGKNANNEAATSSDSTFETGGCTNNSAIATSTAGAITTASGGTLIQDGISLTVPTSFTSTSSAATFQAHRLNADTFYAGASTPTGKNRAGNKVFNLKALTSETTVLSTFSTPLTVTLSYSSSDVTGLNESSLWIHRYDGSSWYPLSSCTVNTGAQTVTCTTTSFSDFAIFGDSNGSSSGGCSTEYKTVGYTRYETKCGVTVAYDITPIPLPVFLRQYNTVSTSTAVVVMGNNATSTLAASSMQGLGTLKFMRDLNLLSNGQDVKDLQIYLNTNGFVVASSGPGSLGNETNVFGTKTKNALIRFQKAKKITPAVGFFGPITRAFVNSAGVK